MLNKLKQKIESKRNSENIFWRFLVIIKDFLWNISQKLEYIWWIAAYNRKNFMLSVLELFKIHEFNFDVDVVYTYADDNNPERKKQKEYFSKDLDLNNPLSKESLASRRFNDYGELKYSLRSVELFAPWVRNIYIVTPTPNIPWLNLDSKKHKIYVVSNESIFPDKSYVPSFNACAIELFLDKIPGLTEHFIYFNDDMFLGNYVNKNDFFTAGGKCQFDCGRILSCKGKKNISAPLYKNIMVYNQWLIKQKYGAKKIVYPIHQARPFLKSMLDACKKEFPAECAATASNRFREPNNINIAMFICPFYTIYKNFGFMTNKLKSRQMYVPIKNNLKINENMLNHLLIKKPKLFCLNDGTDCYNFKIHNQIEYYLNKYFPGKSAFEI